MLRAGHGLMLCAIALLVFGVVMVNSAGLAVRTDEPVTFATLLVSRTTALAGLAILAMLIGSVVPVRRLFLARGLASPIPWLIVLTIGLLLAVYVPGVGREVNGARRWITMAGINFQPSELAKWTLIVILAWHATRRAGSVGDLIHGFTPAMILVGVICALIVTEDLGTAALIAAVSVALLIAAGSRIWHAALLMPVGAVGFLAALLASPYRVDRIKAFVNPFDDPQGIGYHVIQSMSAVHSGGLAGRGLGNAVHKFGYLPEDTTDFIFAIICEELGLAGAIGVITIYVIVLLCGLAVWRKVAHPFERLVCLGVMLMIGMQAVINIAVVTGAAPTKGIALPLLSAGGSGWVLTSFCIGLLVSIDRKASVGCRVDRALLGNHNRRSNTRSTFRFALARSRVQSEPGGPPPG